MDFPGGFPEIIWHKQPQTHLEIIWSEYEVWLYYQAN